MGSMYAAVLYIGVQNSGSVQPVVVVERTVFYRERAAGMYSAFPYAFGQVRSSHINSAMPDSALLRNLAVINFSLTGCHRIPVYTGSVYHIWHHSVLDDWF
jgi:hypothetical protein